MSTPFRRILQDTGKDYFSLLTALYGALTAGLVSTRTNNAGRVLQPNAHRIAGRSAAAGSTGARDAHAVDLK